MFELIEFVFSVEDSISDDGQECLKYVLELIDIRVEEISRRKHGPQSEPELRPHDEHVLVEVLDNELGVAALRLAPVGEQQAPQKGKLTEGLVAGTRGLQPLMASQTYPDVRCHDHVNVIGSIPDSQRHLVIP